MPAFVGFEVDDWVVGALVDDAAGDHSERQCASRHIDGKEEYRPEEKAVFYRVHVVDGEVSRFAYRLVEIVGFGVVFPIEVWTVVGIRFKEVGATMMAPTASPSPPTPTKSTSPKQVNRSASQQVNKSKSQRVFGVSDESDWSDKSDCGWRDWQEHRLNPFYPINTEFYNLFIIGVNK